MASWQSRFINPFLRLRVKRVLATTNDPAVVRRLFGAPMPPPRGARYEAGTLGGVAGEWTRPAHGTPAAGTPPARLLFLHGGGYLACTPQSHRSITAAYAIRGFEVFSPAYRLAPEHPFPAAVEDALAAFRAMPAPFVIGGDSAGGGLALAAMFAARTAGLPLPAAALLFSPWTDLACTGASLVTNAKRDPMLYGPRMREGAEIYLAGADPLNPLASPLYGDFTGLPPLLIQVGADEILLDDSRRVADRARAAGVAVDYSEWPDMPHVWHVSQVILPESRRALDLAAAFGLRALASTGSPA